MITWIKLLFRGGIIKAVWVNGIKKQFIKPFLISTGIIGGAKSIHDLAQWEMIQKGLVIGSENGKPMSVIILTPIVNLYQWIMNGNLTLFIYACINNISYYLKMPFVIVTYSIMFIFVIIAIIIIYYYFYKYVIKMETPILDEKNQVVKSPFFQIMEEKINEAIYNKEVFNKLQKENKELLIKRDNLINQVAVSNEKWKKINEELNRINKEKQKLVLQNIQMAKEEKVLKLKVNKLTQQVRKLEKNKVIKKDNSKKGKVVKKEISKRSKAAKKGWLTRRKDKLNFIN